MATAIPDSTNLVSIEETDFSSSVSEAVFQKLGGGINYAINTTAGFDSRLDVLETPFSWAKITSIPIYVSGGSLLANQPVISEMTYLVDRKRLIFSYRGTTTIMTAWGDHYYIPMPPAVTVNISVMSYDSTSAAYNIPLGTAMPDATSIDTLSGPTYTPARTFVQYDLSVNRIRAYFPVRLIGVANGDVQALISGIIPLS